MDQILDTASGQQTARGKLTLGEIRQQPDVWGTTLEQVVSLSSLAELRARAALICGAGSSAYAASAVALAWRNARAIATTDLLVLSREELTRLFPDFVKSGVLLSLARSGDSPESVGVITRLKQMLPEVAHVAITCNQQGQLAHIPGVQSIVLDPRTNDRSLVMTGSFSNLVLAGLVVEHGEYLAARLPQIAARARNLLPELETSARQLAMRKPSRVAILTPPGLAPLGQEACLKMLEMTAGRVVALSETYLGLRHGPMSFVTDDTLVVCLPSSDSQRRLYELDVIREVQQKKLGYLVLVSAPDAAHGLAHHVVPALAADLADELRTPFEIVFPQLLGYHLSLGSGLDPDNPSPDGVITRVVRNFQLHDNGTARTGVKKT